MKTFYTALTIILSVSSVSYTTANQSSIMSFLEESEGIPAGCGTQCNSDDDCHKGGYVKCGTCTNGFCIPEGWQPGDGGYEMCGRSCSHKSDCQSEYEGTRNECMECDSDIGICVPPSTSGDDAASTTDTVESLNDFIEESSGFCGEYCDHNDDCPQGGFDPCNQCKENHCVKESWEKENRGGRGLEMCGQTCENRLDCRSEYSGTENQCMECNNGRCTNQESNDESATEELFPDFIEEKESATEEDNESTSSMSFLKEIEEIGNTCGLSCENNNDCFNGGFVECGRCRLLEGRDVKTCVPKNIAPQSRGYEMCGLPCEHNNDCKAEYEGTENRCMLCGQREGVFGVKRCVSWDDGEEESTAVTASKYLRAARK